MWHTLLETLPGEAGKFAAGVVLTILLSIMVRAMMLMNRRRMLRFFGISSSCPDLGIFLSRMEVQQTTGLAPITKGYVGPAVLNPELVGAIEARDLFKGGHVVVLSRKIRDWLGQQFIAVAALNPTIQISPEPHKLDGLPKQNVISLGSDVYNSLFRKHNERSQYLEFRKSDTGERGILVKSGGNKGLFLTREGGREIGVIERVNGSSANRALFYCAGLGASATLGCVRYLAQHWEDLFRENGLDEFALYLVFPDQPSNTDTVVDPEEPIYVKHGKKHAWWMHWV
jgi:hypothetical protein